MRALRGGRGAGHRGCPAERASFLADSTQGRRVRLPDRGYAWVFLGASSYGVVSSFVKLAHAEGFGSAEIATAQCLVGFAVMMVAMVIGRLAGRTFAWPSVREGIGALLLGATTGVTSVLYFGALEQLTASLAVVLLFQFTWMGVLVEAILRRRRPSAESVVALVTAWTGTLLAAGVFDDGWMRLDGRGVLLGLGAGVSYTAFVVGTSRVGTTIAPLPRSTIMALGAFVVLSATFPPRFILDPVMASGLAPWAVGLGCIGIAVPNIAFALGAPRIGGERSSIVAAVELPVAVLASYLVLGERLSARALVGVVLILVAVTLPEFVRLRREAKDEQHALEHQK